MYGMNYSGGDNRTHGQIERAERIDSFEAGKLDGWDVLFTSRMFPLDCCRFMEYWPDPEASREVVELWAGERRYDLELTRTPSGFGGSCAFWVCPCCGKRARFLYFKKLGFACRACCKLNYAVQQRTKGSVNHAYDGIRYARGKLRWKPLIDVAPMDFPYITPEGPGICTGVHTPVSWPDIGGIRRSTRRTVCGRCWLSWGR